MAYTGRLISFYRLFDLNSLVEVAHYMSYKQIACGIILGHSASGNQHLKFLQHSVANYLIPDIHKSNWNKLKIPYIHYKFESNIDGDIGFKIISNKFQNNESNIGTLDGLFGIINFLEKPVVSDEPRDEAKPADKVERPVVSDEPRDEAKPADKVERPVVSDEPRDEAKPADEVEKPVVGNARPIVMGDEELKGKSNLLSSTFPDDEVIFRTKLKEMIAKVDSVLEKKEEVERLKQSKKIDEIARKLDEFIQKNILAKQSNEAENPKIEPEKVYSLVVYQSAKQYKFNHYNNVKNPIKLPNSILYVQKDEQNNALVLYKNVNPQQGHKGIEKTQYIFEALTYEEINVCPNNYQQLIGERLRDFRDNNFPYGNIQYKKAEENTQNTIYYAILIVGGAITVGINTLVEAVLKLSNRILPNNTGSFTNDNSTGDSKIEQRDDINELEQKKTENQNNEDQELFDDADNKKILPPPHNKELILVPYYSSETKHCLVAHYEAYIIIFINLGYNVITQEFFQEAMHRVYANIYPINDVYALLPFDLIYEYSLYYTESTVNTLVNARDVFGDTAEFLFYEIRNINVLLSSNRVLFGIGHDNQNENILIEEFLPVDYQTDNTEQNEVTNTQKEKIEENTNVTQEEIEDRGCFDWLLRIFSWHKNDGHDLQYCNYDPYCFEPDPHYPEFNKG